jgi:hypothetical protein
MGISARRGVAVLEACAAARTEHVAEDDEIPRPITHVSSWVGMCTVRALRTSALDVHTSGSSTSLGYFPRVLRSMMPSSQSCVYGSRCVLQSLTLDLQCSLGIHT